jgi:hypothetical protein
LHRCAGTLRAVAGQLIQASRARQIERTIVRAGSELGRAVRTADAPELGRTPAELARLGLARDARGR